MELEAYTNDITIFTNGKELEVSENILMNCQDFELIKNNNRSKRSRFPSKDHFQRWNFRRN